MHSVRLHQTQKYDQEVGLHGDYLLICYDERYKIVATPINSNKFSDWFWLEKVKL